MDWTAIGAIGTLAAAIIAFLQCRQRGREVEFKATAQADSKPALVSILVLKTPLSFPFPKNWKVDPYTANDLESAELYSVQQEIERRLSSFQVAQLIIANQSKMAIRDLDVSLGCRDAWSYSVEEVRHLAENSVSLSHDDNFVSIKMASMPAGERVILSIVGRYVSTIPKAGNAGIEIKQVRWWDV